MPDGNSAHATPMLILLSGLPGSGKTTFAHALATRLPLVHVESDAIRRGLARVPRYTPRESATVFARVESDAEAALRAGRHALVDATNLTTGDRRRFVRLGQRLGCRFTCIRMTAPDAVIRERLHQPRSGNSQADEAVYNAMRGRARPFASAAIVVDTRFDLEPAIDLVLRIVHDERCEE
jgi:predicted kinase